MRTFPIGLAALLLSLMSLAPAPAAVPPFATNAATLSASRVRGFAGRTVQVPFSLRHTGAVSGVQFDVSYPSNKLIAGLFQGGAPATNAVLRSRQIAPGLHRVLTYTKDRSVLATNTILGALPMTIPARDIASGGEVAIQDAVVAKSNAVAATPLRVSHGAVTADSVFFSDGGAADLLLIVQSNLTYAVQATTNFQDWVNIATNFAPLDYIVAVDSSAGVYPMRFYRAMSVGTGGGAQIGMVHLDPGGVFTFSYPSEPARRYVIQASTNLTGWENLATNIAAGNLTGFTNVIVPSYPRRFFRILESP